MTRSLALTVNPHKDGGVSLTVSHSEKEGDESSSDLHKTTATEKLPGIAAVQTAASQAIDEYFSRVKADGKAAVEATPIGRAIKAAE